MISVLQTQGQGNAQGIDSAVRTRASQTNETTLPQITPEELRLGLREEPIAHYVFLFYLAPLSRPQGSSGL